MAIEITRSATIAAEPYRLPINSLRWSAVIAGLAVGIATNLFLLLLGAAAGLAAFSSADNPAASVPMAAAVWNVVCMIVAAFAGGYVAARSAGLRRTSDGILHGVVAWGVTMLISTFIVTSVAGATLGTLFGVSGQIERSAGADVARSIDEGRRQEAIGLLRDRLNLSGEQASRLVDQALVLSGKEESASPQGRESTEETLRSASVASGWLSGAVLFSLFAAMGGGLLGARGTRREVRRAVAPPATTL